MANIIRRNEDRGQSQSRGGETRWDPYRVMRDLMGFDPAREVALLLPDERVFVPPFDVRETSDAYIFEADLPGLRQEDLEITLTGNHLTISGKREREQSADSDRYYLRERAAGSFVRTFTLPDSCDPERARAEFNNGVLRLIVPKKPEMQPRRIQLSGERQGGNGSGAPNPASGTAATGKSEPGQSK